MNAEPGLRERKKEQRRQRIADTARRLFAERGFEGVTVAEVAREANVSEGTVFNYFPTKEDLFYSGMESFEAALIEAVRNRPPGQSVLAAFRDYVLEQSDGVADRAPAIEKAARLVDASPALQARERAVVAEYTAALAELLAAETGAASGDIEPRVVAAALMAAQRELVAQTRASVAAGLGGPALVRSVKAQGMRAFARLEAGLGDYGVKSAPGR
jgi:AcrR family transcriptional regulator